MLKGFDHQTMATEIAAGSSTVRHVLVLGDSAGPGNVDLHALCAPSDRSPNSSTVDSYRPDSRSVAVFLLSGGTTGLPKLIARTHDDYLFNAKRNAQVCGFSTDIARRLAGERQPASG